MDFHEYFRLAQTMRPNLAGILALGIHQVEDDLFVLGCYFGGQLRLYPLDQVLIEHDAELWGDRPAD